MYRLPRLLLLLLSTYALCASNVLRAQDAGFHHLTATPLLTNPALTGVIAGDLRIAADYQQRFTGLGTDATATSVLAFVDWRRNVGRYHHYGLGVQVQHDDAGSSDYVRSQAMLSGSYQQRLGGHRGQASYLSAGAQVGVGQRGFDFNKIWFSEQYFVNPGTREAYLDRSLPSGEPLSAAGNRLYADLNAGLAWFATLGDRRGVYAGLAAFHLTAPNVSPLPGDSDRLYRRYVAHAGGELPLGRGYLSLLPAVRAMLQGPSFTAQLGGSLRYTERQWQEVALRLLTYAHLQSTATGGPALGTLTVGVGLEWDDFLMSVTYDLQTGTLARVANARGGFELSVIYVRAAKTRSRVFCPRF